MFSKSYGTRKRSKTEKLMFALVIVVTLAFRLYYVYTSPQLELSHDEIGYHEMTLQFLDKGFLGYYTDKPSAFITPGYPLFLATGYTLAGLLNTNVLTTVRIIQVIISVCSVFLVYLIAKKSGGQPAGYIAAILTAIYPPSLMANTRILTEVLYAFLLLLYMYSVIVAFDKRGLYYHALSGGMLALAVLVRPAVAPFLVVPYLFQIVFRRDFRVLPCLLIAMVAFCMVMTPWWVRNYMVFDKFIVFATQSGNPLLRGTDPYDPYDRIGPSIINDVPEEEMTGVALQRIKEGFRTEPLLWAKWFTVGKFSFLWSKPWGAYSDWAKNLHYWVFVIFGWLGTIVNTFDRNMRWPALMVLFSTALQLFFIPIARYMYPLTPIMAIMAAVLLVKFVRNRLDTAYLNS